MANLAIKTPSSASLVLIFQLLVLRPRPNVVISKLAPCQKIFKVFFIENMAISKLAPCQHFFKVFFLGQFFLRVERLALLSTFC